ncbi:MAG: 50S ribosomal protein L6 [Acidobacteriota bacterium]
MSRVGRMPIPVPDKVQVVIGEDHVEVKGPKGLLRTPVLPGISCALEGKELRINRADDTQSCRAFHGLTRALLANAVHGVTQGYKKELDIVGVGYKANVEGRKAVFNLGYSHPIEFPIPEGIEIAVEKSTHVVVTGADRQSVGQVAAQIRAMKKPEPYKGKGVMYTGEKIIRKAGKAAK